MNAEQKILRPSRSLLEGQAELVGALSDLEVNESRELTPEEKELLEGVWNLLHAMLDMRPGDVAILVVREDSSEDHT